MYRLHLTYPSGTTVTLSFPSAFLRGLHVILLASLPVDLRLEDPVVCS
jgi:hypothetical protein